MTQLQEYIDGFTKANLRTELIQLGDRQVLTIYHEDYFGNNIKSKMTFDLEGKDAKNYKEPYSIKTI
jgi:hypothetical protein